jgi:hypothetical protein
VTNKAVMRTVFLDELLIPLRDDPGRDEMLRITGKPERIRKPARV